uniref:Uncharacterized protein n=1 Tax=Manihot esculenta TaxID=3983 RepID=A0A2C9U9D1_MANES
MDMKITRSGDDLRDELVNIVSIPPCNYGLQNLVIEMQNAGHLMQFLMGLNDAFDQVCNQVLLLDQLSTMNKAFLMVLQVESQKEV